MPVSTRISDMVKYEQTKSEKMINGNNKHEHSTRTVENQEEHKESGDASSSASQSLDIQQLSFDGLTVTTDTSLAGVASARKKRRRSSSLAARDKKKKKKKEEDERQEQLKSLYQKSTPLTKQQLSHIHSYKEKRLVTQQQQRDSTLVNAAIRHEIIEQKESGHIVALPDTFLSRAPEKGNVNVDDEESVHLPTWKLSQSLIADNVDLRTRGKMFDLKLNSGPYHHCYTRNGKHLLLAGENGHISIMDWMQHKLLSEMNVNDHIHAASFLHNYQMFALAQNKYVYLYDHTGLELHVLKHHITPRALQYLPYHFLLVSTGGNGFLSYQDTSTGQLVIQHRTKLGECQVMTQNKSNAIIHLGHANGTVTLWSPNISTPLVTMLTHKSSVTSLACDEEGNHLVTSGLDGQVKVWDIRTYKQLHSYYTVRPTTTISISQAGMLALGYASHLAVWKDALASKQQSPYLVQEYPGHRVSCVGFCPYEDVLGVSHSNGYSSCLVPGAGFNHFDSNEVNPFESTHQRKEAVVHQLLEKLQPEMITLNPSLIGMMDSSSKAVFDSDRSAIRTQREKLLSQKRAEKEKTRGGQKSSKRWKRKRANIIDAASMKRKEQIEQKTAAARKEREQQQNESDVTPTYGLTSILSRFKTKK